MPQLFNQDKSLLFIYKISIKTLKLQNQNEYLSR